MKSNRSSYLLAGMLLVSAASGGCQTFRGSRFGANGLTAKGPIAPRNEPAATTPYYQDGGSNAVYMAAIESSSKEIDTAASGKGAREYHYGAQGGRLGADATDSSCGSGCSH